MNWVINIGLQTLNFAIVSFFVGLVLKFLKEQAAYIAVFLSVVISGVAAMLSGLVPIPFLSTIIFVGLCSYLLSKWTTAAIFPQAAFAAVIGSMLSGFFQLLLLSLFQGPP